MLTRRGYVPTSVIAAREELVRDWPKIEPERHVALLTMLRLYADGLNEHRCETCPAMTRKSQTYCDTCSRARLEESKRRFLARKRRENVGRRE